MPAKLDRRRQFDNYNRYKLLLYHVGTTFGSWRTLICKCNLSFHFRSDSGVVNIYDKHCLEDEFPKPIKAIMNLTTKIDKLKFNNTRYVC
jgi:hypothetical protein